MEARVTLPIPAHLAGERADKILAELTGISRKAAALLFVGVVTVDGESVAASQRLHRGVMEFPAPPPTLRSDPEPVDFAVIYEDSDLLVVDKPAGLVVHPGAGRVRGTLAEGLLYRYPDLEGVGDPGRFGIVHRLDQGTSGLLLVARTVEVHRRLTADLRLRKIHRSYLALVHGVPDMPTGTIDAPIGRDPAHPTRMKVMAGGRPSRTHYRVLSRHRLVALLDIELETGRTHQIRVHLAAIDHPVVGDRTYSRRRDPVPVGRMFLHAYRLRFVHPVTEEDLVVESVLPPDLESVLVELARVYPDPAVES
ncbi:MAG: RluA family pseudouridine synthase [Acidimicrobiia bacterium]|nr:RluA family pseudouridine synthase [Acidimicrobiia bacterium]